MTLSLHDSLSTKQQLHSTFVSNFHLAVQEVSASQGRKFFVIPEGSSEPEVTFFGMRISYSDLTKYVNKKLQDLNLSNDFLNNIQDDLNTIKATYFDCDIKQVPFLLVMEYLGLEGIAHTSKLLSPSWEIKSAEYLRLLKNGAFGAEKWKKRFNVEVGEEPPLPKNILEILTSPCSFWCEQGLFKAETRMLVLNPAIIKYEEREEPLGISFFAGKYIFIPETILRIHGHKHNKVSTWVLMTRGIIPKSKGSRNIGCSHFSGISEYKHPSLLTAITCCVADYVNTGTSFFDGDEPSYIACQELCGGDRIVVGKEPSEGFVVSDTYDIADVGLAEAIQLN